MVNVRSFLAKLTKSGIHITKAFIFGSYVKGYADEWSDIDIAIVSPQIGTDRFEERVRLTEISLTVDDRLEPMPFNLESFVDDDPMVRVIKNEGIAIVS